MTGIGEIFRRKCRELAVGEGGSALALTLAFLLPAYLLVIAVYGVSETVRRKIELQNAADSAAYSAATVQADYLSRIAVLNKAVAWSYADMTRRQLDYGMGLFTTQTLKLFNEDFNLARSKNNNDGCHMHVIGVNWSAGWSPGFMKGIMKFTLNFAGSGFGISRLLEAFNDQSFFRRFSEIIGLLSGLHEIAGKGLTNLVEIEKHALRMTQCSTKMTKYLAGGEMKKEIEKAANDILDLNTREIDDEVLRYVRVGNPALYLTPLMNTEADERKLLQHAMTFDKAEDYDQARFFGKGIGYWYKRVGYIPGIKRGYHQQKKHLHAEWSYFWTKWQHVWIPFLPDLHLPPFLRIGKSWDLVNRKYDATSSVYRGFTENMGLGVLTVPAFLYTLNEPVSGSGLAFGSLFGKEGTIVVGLARKNSNPLRLFGSTGLVTAFDPTCCGKPRPDYIWALSAARAAYNAREADYRKGSDVKSKVQSPNYRLDFTNPTDKKYLWNLREADWDAMFVPVKNANSLAMTGVFMPSVGSILKDVMTDKSGWKKKDGDKWVSAGVDWSNIPAPGGFDNAGALKWSDMDKYLYH